jgi:hypothetical protein
MFLKNKIICLTIFFAACFKLISNNIIPEEPIVFLKLDGNQTGIISSKQLNQSIINSSDIYLTGNPCWTSQQVIRNKFSDGVAAQFNTSAIGFVEKIPKMSFEKSFTGYARVKVYDSNKQKYRYNNYIISRLKTAGLNKGKSFSLSYARWGKFVFDLYSNKKKFSLEASPGNYDLIENKWLDIFFVFESGKYMAIYFFNSFGYPMGYKKMPVDFVKFDNNENQKHWAVGGCFWSHPSKVAATFNGEIERIAIWNKALSDEVINDYMTTIRKTVDTTDNQVNLQEKGYFYLNRNSKKWPGIELKKYNSVNKNKILGICKFSGAREMLEFSRLIDAELQEVLVMYAPGNTRGVGVSRKDRRTYLHVEGYYSDTINEKLRKAASKNNDVIIIGHVEFFRLPEDVQKNIIKKVHDGTGLIICYSGNPQKLISTFQLDKTDNINFFRGLPQNYMPEKTEVEEVSSLINFYNCGQGRVALVNWPANLKDIIKHKGLKFHSISYLPQWNEYTSKGWTYQFSLALLSRIYDWVSKKQIAADISDIEKTKDDKIKLTINSKIEAQINLNIFVRNIDNEFCLKRQKIIQLNKGENYIYLSQYNLPAGVFSYDFQLNYNENIIDYGACVINVSQKTSIDSIVCNKKVYRQNEKIAGTIKLNGEIKGKILNIEIYDARRRLIGKEKIFPVQKITEFEISPLWTSTTGNKISIYLNDENELLDKKEIFYNVDRSIELREKFAVSVWAYLPSDYIGTQFLSCLKNYHDIDIYMPHYSHQKETYLRNSSQWALENGFCSVSPSMWREYYYARKDKNDIKRTPCLSDPKYKRHSESKIAKYTKIAADYMPLYFGLGDESFLVGYWKGVNGLDVCNSEFCNNSFRQYLKYKYQSLQKLNSEWDKKYRKWENIKPEIFQEAEANSNACNWLNHRLHMSKVYMDKLLENMNVIKDIVPKALIGPEGFYKPDAFKGYKLGFFSEKFGFLGPYGYSMDPYTSNVFEAFSNSKNNFKRYGITGWYPNINPKGEMYSRYEPWTSMLHGQDGIMLFSAIGLYAVGAVQDGINSNFELSQYWKQLFEEAMLIRNRYYNLIEKSERDNKKIAVYSSENSRITAFLFGSKNLRRPFYYFENRAWDLFLAGASLDHTFISSKQVESGILNSSPETNVLVMPAVFCLSDSEIDEVKKFIEKGGTVIADVMPGVMNEHGSLRKLNPLEDVFGVKIINTKLKENNDIIYYSKNIYCSIEKSMDLKLGSAKYFVKNSKLPYFFINQYGNGKALLANTTMTNFAESSPKGENLETKRFLMKWLEVAKIKAPYSLQSSEKIYNFLECIKYQDGKNHYLSILKSPQFSNRKKDEFEILLDEKKHIYDSPHGKYLGYTNKIKDKLNKKMVNFYSVLPYRVESIEIQDLNPETLLGFPVSLAIKINTSNGLAKGRHFVELKIKDIDERSMLLEINNGTGIVKVPTAFNSKSKIEFEVIDSATGVKGYKSLKMLVK